MIDVVTALGHPLALPATDVTDTVISVSRNATRALQFVAGLIALIAFFVIWGAHRWRATGAVLGLFVAGFGLFAANNIDDIAELIGAELDMDTDIQEPGAHGDGSPSTASATTVATGMPAGASAGALPLPVPPPMPDAPADA